MLSMFFSFAHTADIGGDKTNHAAKPIHAFDIKYIMM